MTKRRGAIAVLAIAASMAATGTRAAELPPSLQDSFRLGSGSGVFCTAQSSLGSPALKTMFDRAYTLVCRDAAAPVGRLYALRAGGDEARARLDGIRGDAVPCAPATDTPLPDIGAVGSRACTMTREHVGYRVYAVTRGRTTYVAEGLEGYDSALQLGLRTIVADRTVPGEIAVATTSVANPGAFARVQAGTLDPAQVLAEAYRRNNSGAYADAAEFFDTLNTRGTSEATRRYLGEYVANQALQRSNLGAFDQADALFAQLARIPTSDVVQLRLRRNYRALHLLNQNRLDDARAEANRPIMAVTTTVAAAGGLPIIDAETAGEINADAQAGASGYDSAALTPAERAEILDAQALQIDGTARRLQGDTTGAQAVLTQVLTRLMAVREGRVTTITRLRAQVLGELSAVAEAKGDRATAERLLREAMTMVDIVYPNTTAAQAAHARLAGYLARQGQPDVALGLFRDVARSVVHTGNSAVGLERLFAPYFALLADRSATDPSAAQDFFLASQTLIRPGVADTQAVLARALSGGSDDAARLFRQSVALSRDVERARIEIARTAALPQQTGDTAAQLATMRTALAKLEADQVATQASLSAYPRYRAVENGAMALADLQGALKPGEAYLKLAAIGPDLYALFASPDAAQVYRLPIDTATLATMVDKVRATISTVVNGSVQISPFDIDTARGLYVALAGPEAARMAQVKHLIFEPDGAMLRLPANLLVTDDASVAAYKARAAKADGDPFDFRGVAWLGRTTDVSTAVSPQSFRDLRAVRPSAAKFAYLGLGDNAPAPDTVARMRLVAAHGGIDCNWPVSAWSDPIQPNELYAAQKAVGGTGGAVVTGAAFSDTALIARDDLSQYRIIHFATHGLVTAPRPQCPARPALLTSFGPTLPDGEASDGLLSFAEVFGLKLDADLVILSACDTAGQASVAATREAGETSGGGSALDGLVRAFVGAGGRAVLASHWPVPNEYNATERLMSQFFAVPRGTSMGDAIRASETRLMDSADTSHPYYWSAFALVGDGAQPLLRAN